MRVVNSCLQIATTLSTTDGNSSQTLVGYSKDEAGVLPQTTWVCERGCVGYRRGRLNLDNEFQNGTVSGKSTHLSEFEFQLKWAPHFQGVRWQVYLSQFLRMLTRWK
jgi:hypothetical protein